jgi:hypothetical protein
MAQARSNLARQRGSPALQSYRPGQDPRLSSQRKRYRWPEGAAEVPRSDCGLAGVAHPVWMREAIKEGKKAEDFLIRQPNGAKKSATKNAKKAGRKKR